MFEFSFREIFYTVIRIFRLNLFKKFGYVYETSLLFHNHFTNFFFFFISFPYIKLIKYKITKSLDYTREIFFLQIRRYFIKNSLKFSINFPLHVHLNVIFIWFIKFLKKSYIYGIHLSINSYKIIVNDRNIKVYGKRKISYRQPPHTIY